MNPKHFLTVATVCSILTVTATAQTADTGWNRVTPEGAGFSVETPGQRLFGEHNNLYEYQSGNWFLSVHVLSGGDETRQLLERRDRKEIKAYLEAERDVFIQGLNARRTGSSSTREGDDHPSIRFSAQTENSDVLMLMVMTGETVYYVRAMGLKGSSDEDGKRFIRSFRVLTPNADGLQ